MKLKERTANNVHTAFVEEAKAHQRLLMFAEKAEKEVLPQIAHLFRAVAAAEGTHSRLKRKRTKRNIRQSATRSRREQVESLGTRHN